MHLQIWQKEKKDGAKNKIHRYQSHQRDITGGDTCTIVKMMCLIKELAAVNLKIFKSF